MRPDSWRLFYFLGGKGKRVCRLKQYSDVEGNLLKDLMKSWDVMIVALIPQKRVDNKQTLRFWNISFPKYLWSFISLTMCLFMDIPEARMMSSLPLNCELFGTPQIRIAPHKAVEAEWSKLPEISLQVDSFFEWESRTGHMKHFRLNLLFFRASSLCLLWRTNGLCFTTRLGGQARTFHGGTVAAFLDGTKTQTLSPCKVCICCNVFFFKIEWHLHIFLGGWIP